MLDGSVLRTTPGWYLGLWQISDTAALPDLLHLCGLELNAAPTELLLLLSACEARLSAIRHDCMGASVPPARDCLRMR